LMRAGRGLRAFVPIISIDNLGHSLIGVKEELTHSLSIISNMMGRIGKFEDKIYFESR
jgi:hypothetical protein